MKEWWSECWPALAWIAAVLFGVLGFIWLDLKVDNLRCKRQGELMRTEAVRHAGMCFVAVDGRWVPIESLRSGLPR